MLGYYISLAVHIFLAATTWLAVAPPMYAKGGAALAVIVCAVTALVEFMGYLAKRDYERTSNIVSLFVAGTIILGSGGLTFWGGKMLEDWAVSGKAPEIRSKWEGKEARVMSEYRADLRQWQSRKDAHDTKMQKRLAARTEKYRADIRAANRIWDFDNQYLDGDPGHFRRSTLKSVQKQVATADAIKAVYDKDYAEISKERFTEPAPKEPSSLEGFQKGKDTEIAALEYSAATYKKMIRGADIAGLLFAIFQIIRCAFTDEKPYIPRHGWSEGLVSKLDRLKESVGQSLEGEDWLYEEKQYEADRAAKQALMEAKKREEELTEQAKRREERIVRAAKERIEEERRKAEEAIKAVESSYAKKAYEAESSYAKKAYEDLDAQAESPKNTDNTHLHTHNGVGAYEGAYNLRFREAYERMSLRDLRTNFRAARGEYKEKGRESALGRAELYWAVWAKKWEDEKGRPVKDGQREKDFRDVKKLRKVAG